MMVLVSFLLSFYAFLHFAMSVKKHHLDVYKGWYQAKPLSMREYRTQQLIAWLALLASFYIAVAHWGIGIGSMAWLMLITVSALLVVALLAYRLNWFQWLWRYTSLGLRVAPPVSKS
ncbi:DUF3325 domain-containing protein [Marinomonas ostreistagni]|uniref:DUF3325 domain-containing protein n=1 Tax=Marinomonas ostreistagni TaxID=359209 RepID=UPI001950E123|nr:DUF3325 domain-containing protein [Marinomonas ostreistagni]MBM6550955.1 DUF3325 domain-containing protein [Marinomonas ostreistagni]